MTEKTETCPSCGNRYDGDNLCAPWACQWEGVEDAPPVDSVREGLSGLAALCRGWADLLDPALDRTAVDFERDVIGLIREELVEQANRADAILAGQVVAAQILITTTDVPAAGVRLSDGKDTK